MTEQELAAIEAGIEPGPWTPAHDLERGHWEALTALIAEVRRLQVLEAQHLAFCRPGPQQAQQRRDEAPEAQ